MPKYVAYLQEEIIRLASQEVAKAEAPLKDAIEALTRRNSALEGELALLREELGALRRSLASPLPVVPAVAPRPPRRKKSGQAVSDDIYQPELGIVKYGSDLVWRIREKFKLSRGQLAALVGVHPANVSRWESGQGDPLAELKSKLEGIFGLSSEAFAAKFGEAKR